MARLATGAYHQKMIGVSSDTFDQIDSLRHKGESFEVFFKRVLPKMYKVLLK
jgi:hypothetical protein